MEEFWLPTGAEEDEHHVVQSCTLARALRDGLWRHWTLPPEYALRKTGEDWFLILLSSCGKDMRVKLIFMLWRAWHHRNNVVHGDGKASVTASVPYLINYVETTSVSCLMVPDEKGKGPVFPDPAASVDDRDGVSSWEAPASGWLKVNVDAG